MTSARTLLASLIVFGSVALLGDGPAAAQDCGPMAGVGGTLSSPQTSCPPAARKPVQPRSGKDAPAVRGERGVVRHGNTEFRYGGSVSTEFGTGRR